ncbi:MAG TPA: hypothetical protein VK524_13655 [Polyangiaceae bacterium]|nr:hypothetical protein [Polyangiaceae bacterium]
MNLARCVAVFLVLTSIPGAVELIEDAAHFLRDGHTPHDRAHANEQPEHCCSGLFHTCTCHPHASATPPTEPPAVLANLPHETRASLAPGGSKLHEHRSRPYRPPTA